MQWNWHDTQRDLVAYRDTRRMSDALVPIIQSWIEMQVRRFGDGLDEEEAIQELWLYVLEKWIPKLEIGRGSGDWHSWCLYCIRQKIVRMKRKGKNRGNVQASSGEA